MLALKEKDVSLKPVKKLNFSPLLLKMYVGAFCHLAQSVLRLLSPFDSKWRHWRRSMRQLRVTKEAMATADMNQASRTQWEVRFSLPPHKSLVNSFCIAVNVAEKKMVTNKFVPLIDADVIQGRKCLSNVDEQPWRIGLVLTSVLSKLLFRFWTRRTTETLRQCFTSMQKSRTLFAGLTGTYRALRNHLNSVSFVKFCHITVRSLLCTKWSKTEK